VLVVYTKGWQPIFVESRPKKRTGNNLGDRTKQKRRKKRGNKQTLKKMAGGNPHLWWYGKSNETTETKRRQFQSPPKEHKKIRGVANGRPDEAKREGSKAPSRSSVRSRRSRPSPKKKR